MYPYLSLSDATNEQLLTTEIYQNIDQCYYWTNDWSPEMYDALVFAGFIPISVRDAWDAEFLLPEMQESYAVLFWNNVHVSKRLRDFIQKHVMHNEYTLSINREIGSVLDGIGKYHAENDWMTDSYRNLLKSLHRTKQLYRSNVVSVELWDRTRLIGGEVGYLVGSIYTSLSGFFDRENYSNFGKIQLLSLAGLLKQSGYAFWNMGHPYMPYKFQLGGLKLERQDFLSVWLPHRIRPVSFNLSGQVFRCQELLKEFM